MLYTEMTKKAMNIAYFKHNYLGKDGVPYVFHPYHLAEQMGDDEYAICVALLHDVAEDTDMTLEDIKAEGFPDEVMTALDLLTHKDKDDYLGSYIRNIKKNEIARKVKLADLKHNSDVSRLPESQNETVILWEKTRMLKYQIAIDILEGKID